MTSRIKNIWIIGGTSGIGRALGIELAKAGHNVAISGRNTQALESMTALLHTIHPQGKHLSVYVDVCNYSTIEQAKHTILAQWQQISTVIFMSGIYEPMPSDQLNIPAMEKVIQTNLTAALYVANITLPHLTTIPNSQLVLCGSVAGYIGLPYSQPYSATKAALRNYAQSLRIEFKDIVDIKLISPGFVETRLTEKNAFHMPFIISPENAAQRIYKQLDRKAFEIHFPKRLSVLLKCIAMLPTSWYVWLAKKLAGHRDTIH